MIRAIIAVIVGYIAWSCIWLGGGVMLLPETTEVITDPGTLAIAVVLSVVCSLVAGAVCALIAGGRSRRAVLFLAGALLATGIMVQIGAWSQMPVWYHLTFLVLLLPMTIAGGRLVPGGKKTAST